MRWPACRRVDRPPRAIQPVANRTGLGLGLAICKKAMDAMDGELRIEDLPGRGCIFTVDLPKQPPPPTSIHAPRRQPTEGSSSGGGRLARAI